MSATDSRIRARLRIARADFRLVAIVTGTVQMPIATVDCTDNDIRCLSWIDFPKPQPDGW